MSFPGGAPLAEPHASTSGLPVSESLSKSKGLQSGSTNQPQIKSATHRGKSTSFAAALKATGGPNGPLAPLKPPPSARNDNNDKELLL